MEGEGFSPGRCSVGKQYGSGSHCATARRKWSKEGKKIAILNYFQEKEGANAGCRKGMCQYWKNYGLFELEEKHMIS